MKNIEGRLSVSLIAAALIGAAASAAAEPQERTIYGVPQHPQDAFLGVPGCSAVDAGASSALSIEEAVNYLEPCMKGLAKRYDVPVTAAKGAVGVDGGSGEAWGILVHVPGDIRKGNNILMDLSFAIREQRKGKLLGLPAGVFSGINEEAAPTASESAPGIPAWLDRPSLRLDAKLSKRRLEGELHVALFDKDDNEVEFSVPAEGTPGARGTVTFTKADDEEAGPYTVESLEAGNPGALGAMAAAAAMPAELDIGTRQAVQKLFENLRGFKAAGRQL